MLRTIFDLIGKDKLRKFHHLSTTRIKNRIPKRFVVSGEMSTMPVTHFSKSNSNKKIKYRSISSDISDMEMEPFMTEIDEICDTNVDNLRNTLYLSLDSPFLDKMTNARTVSEVLDLISRFKGEINEVPAICQTIIVLWDNIREEMTVSLLKTFLLF